MVPFQRSWCIPDAIQIACVMEASAPKLGNVHPGAGFHDMRFEHFVASASAIAAVFRDSRPATIGSQILESTRQMRLACNTNTHLGTILLIAPLAHAILQCQRTSSTSLADLKNKVQSTLAGLTREDCADVYAAIRITAPGGLGNAAQADVTERAPSSLVEAMRLAPKHDSVAQQYVCNFSDVLDRVLPTLEMHLRETQDPLEAIAETQLDWLSEELDGLIVRKVGGLAAEEIRSHAANLKNRYAKLAPETRPPLPLLHNWQQLDASMRCPSNRLNPGTTADLIAAALFVRLAGFKSETS